ncbi:MAG: pilus assembly protein N-terminal domain-containing protein [Desulfuromonadales bacterium]|nr:pilus assembly protein N-terminal domain-containing protein [Desulfuromonadales bacterium]
MSILFSLTKRVLPFTARATILAFAFIFAAVSSGFAQQWAESIELQTGETKDVSTNHLLRKIIIGNPDVVDVQVVGKQQVVLVAKNLGHTSVILRGDDDTATKFDVFTSPDTTLLKKRINDLFPGQDIKIYSNKEGVILSGTVTGAEIVEQVLRVTRQILSAKQRAGSKSVNVDKKLKRELDTSEIAFIMAANQGGNVQLDSDDTASGTGTSGLNIVNLLTVGGPQQVMLEVKFAEVSRQSGRDLQAAFKLGGLGSDFRGAAGVNPLGINGKTGDLPGLDLGSLLVNFAGINEVGNIFINIDDFSLALHFLEEESLARILAEPRLVTQSGQEASFLAGGEYPYPIVDNDNVEIEFKEFGVGLKFTPIINSNGLITLKVAPSVTDITGFVELDSGDQPVLSTRRLESTVHLRDGQTLALAGLLQENMSEAVRKVPYLGDLPVIGTLFRSSTYQNNKTDLVVAVTPHIVQPVQEGDISFPGEFIKEPSRFEFYLEGMLEGRRSPEDTSSFLSHSFATSSLAGGGLEGDFGQTQNNQ